MGTSHANLASEMLMLAPNPCAGELSCRRAQTAARPHKHQRASRSGTSRLLIRSTPDKRQLLGQAGLYGSAATIRSAVQPRAGAPGGKNDAGFWHTNGAALARRRAP
jgi:hypothetical protein